ncbi:MBL fold metallo-hydrolase [Catenulispora rubra]|uniref:MBL fold metallo-hydrolase n=1 Tax=Catenulispora rubra TaxID=280293 RepID=UPI00189236F5|nr:MBL fold metallo-hydrolase [Catenulispora rubra]
MLVAGFPAGSLGANCYLVAPGAGEQCVIIDPGEDAAAGVEEAVREHKLQPVAVLLTHGHVDHTMSVIPVCGDYGVPAYVHPDDRGMLTDPQSWLGIAPGTPIFGRSKFVEPDEVRELTDGVVLSLAGLEITVDHAPGHTKGSVTFRTPEQQDIPKVLFTGDLLFAGAVGRWDLPGGDRDELLASLARVCLPQPDETVVLSGHGPQTTIGRERATNPFLTEAAPQQITPRGL